MSPETPIGTLDPVAAAASAVASARGDVPVRDWLATGTGAFDRYSSSAPDALIAVALGRPAPTVSRRRSRLLAAAGFVLGAWERMRVARRAFRGVRLPARVDYVVRTWASPGSFHEGRFADPYFGRLAVRLEEAGIQALTVVGALSAHSRVYGAAASAPGPVVPEHLFLRWSDPLAVAAETLRRRPGVSGRVELAGTDVSAIVRASLDEEHGRRQVFANRLQGRIGRRIVERLSPRTVALTHEGYAWERQFALGARDASPAVALIGLQHAPITPAQTALRFDPASASASPDLVVTPGRAGADELARRGYPADRVVIGGSLRAGAPASGTARTRPQASGDVLVVLGDFERSLRAVRAVRDLPPLVPGRRVVLRLHPLTPGDRFMAALGFDPASAGLAVSDGGPLAAELARASGIIYDASLVALEAVAGGVPAVHLDLGDLLSTDPLEGLTALHARASGAADAGRALDGFAALSDDDFARQAAEARAFVRDVLGEAGDATYAAFLPSEREQR